MWQLVMVWVLSSSPRLLAFGVFQVTARSLAREHQRVCRELEAAQQVLHDLELQESKLVAADGASPRLAWLTDAVRARTHQATQTRAHSGSSSSSL